MADFGGAVLALILSSLFYSPEFSAARVFCSAGGRVDDGVTSILKMIPYKLNLTADNSVLDAKYEFFDEITPC
jgi:hypothetical protein